MELAWTTVEGLTKRNYYADIFKGGQAEACRLSGIPEPEDRIKATAKARNAKDKPPETPARLEEEVQADEEEAALAVAQRKQAAEERAQKAKNKRLKLEAMNDPKKIIYYLGNINSPFMKDFFHICEEEKIAPQEAWDEALEGFGSDWEDWKSSVYAEDQNGNQIDPDLDEYVEVVVEPFIDKKNLKLALDSHREDIYTFICWRCGERYEFEIKENYATFTCPNECKTKNGHASFYLPCPVCRDLGRENGLFYDPPLNLLFCTVCRYMRRIQGPPLAPKGTKAGVFKPQIAELEEKVKSLNVRLNEIQRQINVGERKEQALERRIREKEKTREKLSKTIAALSAETEEKRRECVAERCRAEELKGENKRVEERREVFNAVAEFLMDPELITGEQLANVVKTLSAAQKMRGQQGHVGESVKMTVEVRDRLLMRIAGGRYVLKDEAEKRLKEEIARQRHEDEKKLREMEAALDAERRRRETAEKERAALMPWRDEDMDKLKEENRRLRDRLITLEGKNADLKSQLHLQRIMASS